MFVSEGNFGLSVVCEEPVVPPSGSCGYATLITCENDVIDGNNIETASDSFPCGLPNVGKVVWYRIIGVDGDITVST